MDRLAVIVSSFNRAELLKEALASLDRTLFGLPFDAAVYVFDAGSSDGSRELVRRFESKRGLSFELLGPLPTGGSFSAGVNFSASHALRHSQTRWLMLFETDNYLCQLNPILDAVRLMESRPEIGATGFTVRKHDGTAAGFGCPFPRAFEFLLGPNLAHLLRLDRPKLNWEQSGPLHWTDCEVVFTSPIVIQREAWERTGGFDAERFPFSDCDLDWAWRLRECGFRQAVITTDGVVHDNQRQPSAWSARRALHFHRARLRWLQRHRQAWPRLLAPCLFLRHAAELLVCWRDPRRRWPLLKSVWSGYE